MTDKDKMIKLVKERAFENAFDSITSSNWWSDDTMTDNVQRENFLYQTYFAYYDLLTIDGVKGLDRNGIAKVLHRVKQQLDVEIKKIKNGIYEPNEVIT